MTDQQDSATRVTVVVTTYRQRQFLPDALDSVLAQELPASEIIVVDDGSPEPVDDLVAAYPGVRLHRQDNQGANGARNAGLALATSPLIVFLDGDDRLLPNALAVGVRSLRGHPDAPLTSGASQRISADGQIHGGVLVPQPRDDRDLFLAMLRRSYICPPGAAMFRRAALIEQGGWLQGMRLAEDLECFLRVARSAPPTCHGELIAQYRIHDGQTSQDPQLEQSIVTLLRQYERAPDSDRRTARAARAGQRFYRATLQWFDARPTFEAHRTPRSFLAFAISFVRVLPYRIRDSLYRRGIYPYGANASTGARTRQDNLAW